MDIFTVKTYIGMEVGENYGHLHGKDFKEVTTVLQCW